MTLDTQGPADVVVAGHICLDLILAPETSTAIAPGQLVHVGPVELSTGGAVANTGLALCNLGVTVRLIGKVGDDLFGGAVIAALQERDPRLADDVAVAAGEATSYSIVINPMGRDRTFLHFPGANDTFTADDVDPARLTGARLFHFGYPPLMRRMYADSGAELSRLFACVREADVVTSLDLSRPDPDSDAGRADWESILGQTLPFVDVFAPSIEELLFMIDRPSYDALVAGSGVVAVELLRSVGADLTRMGPAVVAIKLGERGLYVRTSSDGVRMNRFCARLGLDAAAWVDREVVAPGFVARQVAGTTGAGDCAIAGLLTALLFGHDPVDAATYATAVGAASVEAPAATDGVPSWREITERVAAGWPRHASA